VLNDRVAFITGGGRGIGRAIALAFAADGARTAVAARSGAQVESVAAEVVRAGGEALHLVCDVTSTSDVKSAIQETTGRFGPVDILVNNAGYVESAPVMRVSDESWNQTLAVNLTGTFLCLREVMPAMIARRQGRVINIASTAAEIGYAYTAAYCAAKHGVLGLTRSVALEVAAKGITVNAICPGWVDTAMTEESIDRIVRTTGRSADAARATLESMNPQGRLIRPEEVARVAVWLASDAAAGVTGQAYNVDGLEAEGVAPDP
jgi:NAD(P)-dependent dehydrogenase (short-subunit alcohol dehydrogenase family)